MMHGIKRKTILAMEKLYFSKKTVETTEMRSEVKNNLSTPFSLNEVTILRMPVSLSSARSLKSNMIQIA